MNLSELDDSLSAAINALSAAQATLRKGAANRDLDILRKLDDPPQPRPDAAEIALAALDDLTRRVNELKDADATRANADAMRKFDRTAARADLDAQHSPRRTVEVEV
jgi:hypothetical protein